MMVINRGHTGFWSKCIAINHFQCNDILVHSGVADGDCMCNGLHTVQPTGQSLLHVRPIHALYSMYDAAAWPIALQSSGKIMSNSDTRKMIELICGLEYRASLACIQSQTGRQR